MINLCKCCFLVEDQKSVHIESDSLDKIQDQILDPECKIEEHEPLIKTTPNHNEEDSGTCADHSNSSAENMLDHLVDKVQLTVSSVNSILPELPESPKPPKSLLFGDPEEKTIPMVVLAASKRQTIMHQSSEHSVDNSESVSLVKPALKKPKPLYARQCSAPSTSSTLVTPPVSGSSSRRDSGEKSGSEKSSAKNTVVSFHSDVKYLEDTQQPINTGSLAEKCFYKQLTTTKVSGKL